MQVKEWLKDNTERKGKLTGTPYPGSKEAKVAAKAKKETKTPQANKASAIPVSSATVANTLETSSADLVGKVKAVISTKAADPTSVVPEMSTDAPENHPLQSLKEVHTRNGNMGYLSTITSARCMLHCSVKYRSFAFRLLFIGSVP